MMQPNPPQIALGTLEPMWLIPCDFVNERRRT